MSPKCINYFVKILAVSSLIVACNPFVYAASTENLDQRLRRLENLLNNQVLIEQSQRLDQVQQELSAIRELVENQDHELILIQQRQRNLYQDIDQRLNDMEEKSERQVYVPSISSSIDLNSSSGSSPVPPPGAVEMAERTAPSSEGGNGKHAYTKAFNLLKQGKYREAITALKAFQKSYPNSTYGVNAQYWLGEAHSVTRDYKTALSAFQSVVNNYPKSNKVEGAMLKIGYTYYEMGDWVSAKVSLEAVINNYPDKPVARKAKERLERIKREGH